MFGRKKKHAPSTPPAFLGHPYPDYLAMRARAEAVVLAHEILEEQAGPRLLVVDGPCWFADPEKDALIPVGRGDRIVVAVDTRSRADVTPFDVIQLARYIETGR